MMMMMMMIMRMMMVLPWRLSTIICQKQLVPNEVEILNGTSREKERTLEAKKKTLRHTRQVDTFYVVCRGPKQGGGETFKSGN